MGNDNFQSKECADRLKALSEPLRLRIVDILRHGEMTVGDIAEFLETELVTVSHHLKILKHAGLWDTIPIVSRTDTIGIVSHGLPLRQVDTRRCAKLAG